METTFQVITAWSWNGTAFYFRPGSETWTNSNNAFPEEELHGYGVSAEALEIAQGLAAVDGLREVSVKTYDPAAGQFID